MSDRDQRQPDAPDGLDSGPAAAGRTPAAGSGGLASAAEQAAAAVHKGSVPGVARYAIGDVVRHRHFPFRGVIFDVDPEFANSEEWYQSIPEDIRPHKDQPYYHLLAENEQSTYVAYVSQQNLLHDENCEPVSHPAVHEVFSGFSDGKYHLRPGRTH